MQNGDEHRPILADHPLLDARRDGTANNRAPTPGMIAAARRAELEAAKFPGIEQEIDKWIERLKTDPEASLRAKLASNAGIGYREALDRWADHRDLAVEWARQWLKFDDSVERHHACGTRPDEVLDLSDPDNIRPLDNPMWKLYRVDCWTCRELNALNDDLTDADRANGTSWEVRPAEPGDDWIDG